MMYVACPVCGQRTPSSTAQTACAHCAATRKAPERKAWLVLEPLPRRFSLQEMMLTVVFACIVALVYRGSPEAAYLTIVGAGLGVTTSFIKEINYVLAIVLFAGFCWIGFLALSPLASVP